MQRVVLLDSIVAGDDYMQEEGERIDIQGKIWNKPTHISHEGAMYKTYTA